MASLLRKVIALARGVAALLFFALLICVLLGVVSRYAFNAPLTFTDEVAGYLFAGAVLLGMAVTAFHGGHIRVDVLLNPLRPRTRRRIEAAHWAISMGYVGLLLASGWLFFANAFDKGLRAPTVLQTPLALVAVVLPVSMALFLFERIVAPRHGGPRVPNDSDKGHGL